MKIKEFLKQTVDLNSNLNSNEKGIFGKELKIIEPYFSNFDELKDKKIEIIEDLLMVGDTIMNFDDGGVSYKQETDPKMVTVNGFNNLKDDIKLYGIFLMDDNIFIRCSEDSLI